MTFLKPAETKEQIIRYEHNTTNSFNPILQWFLIYVSSPCVFCDPWSENFLFPYLSDCDDPSLSPSANVSAIIHMVITIQQHCQASHGLWFHPFSNGKLHPGFQHRDLKILWLLSIQVVYPSPTHSRKPTTVKSGFALYCDNLIHLAQSEGQDGWPLMHHSGFGLSVWWLWFVYK